MGILEMASKPLHLFEGYGVELEYMIVRRDDLSVLPVSDEILKKVAGEYTSEVELGALAWCNEVVLHVIEFKTNGPARKLDGLAGQFTDHVGRVNEILAPMGGMLLPTGMHPWMDPHTETRLWPHEYSPVYDSYNRIFGCKGHGWSNLQSMHMNLPFGNDEEFGRLHAAIRLVLPILPALAASTPVMDGRSTGYLDNRLEVYRFNQKKVPSIAGRVIPEPVFHPQHYQEVILQQIYRDIAPHDPEEILRDEWLNSRGAIARFCRNSIEIRVLDLQESAHADLAVYRLVAAVLMALTEERWISYEAQQRWQVEPLAAIFEQTVRDADETLIADRDYAAVYGVRSDGPVRAGDIWRHLADELLDGPDDGEWQHALEVILGKGCLARRIMRALDGDLSRPRLQAVYRKLAQCAASGELFDGGAL